MLNISIGGTLYELRGNALHKAADVKQCGRGWTGTKPPGCRRAEKKTQPKGVSPSSEKVSASKRKSPKAAKPQKEELKPKVKNAEVPPVQANSQPEVQSDAKPDASIVKVQPKQEAQSAEEKYASSNPTDEDAINFAQEYLQRERKAAYYEGTVEAILSLKDVNPAKTTPARYAKMKKEAEEEAKTLSDEQIIKKYGKNANLSYKDTWEWSLNNDKERLASAQAEKVRVAQSTRISEASKANRLKKLDKEIADAAEGIKFFTAKLSGMGDDGGSKAKATLDSKRRFALGVLGKEDEYDGLFAVASHLGAVDMIGYHLKQQARKYSRSPQKQRQFLEMKSREQIKDHLRDLYNGNIEGSEAQDKKVLGVQGEVTRENLKAAYRQASAKAHPDRGGSKEAFQRVQRAYENLRQKYNLAKCLISIGGAIYEWAETEQGLCLVKAARQKLEAGATKTQNGKTYVLNENRRWALKREEGAAPKNQRSVKPKESAKPTPATKPVAPAKEKKPLKPKFSVLEGGGNPDAGEKTFSGGSEVAKLAQKLMSNKPELDAMVAKGKETASKIEAKYGKKKSNSRIVGAKEAAKYFQGYDQDTQLGWLDHHISLMDSLEGSPAYIEKANSHFNQVWQKATPEVKAKIAQKWGGKVKNPLVGNLLGEKKAKLTPIEGGGKSKGKGKAKLTPIEGGKEKPVEQMSLKEMFAEGDRVGSKYQTEPKTLDERREAKQGAQKFMDETGATEAGARASGKVRQLKPKSSQKKPATVNQAQLAVARDAMPRAMAERDKASRNYINEDNPERKEQLKGEAARLSQRVQQLKSALNRSDPNPWTENRARDRAAIDKSIARNKRKSLRPKAQTPIEHIETSPEIQEAAAQSPKIASAIQQIKKNPSILEKVQAAAIKNPGAVEDIAVAAIAMAGQFALMPQADLATAALMQGAIGVATRAGARAGRRIREELKADPNTLKSLQGAIKMGKGILSDLMSQETQEKMISDAIGPAMAAGTGAAVGGGLAGTVAGTGAAVGAAPKAAGAIRQTIANKLQPKRKPLALKHG